ncbi:glycosyltransferase [Corynebacterium suedekumii]|nr:glycosyltransferase [Corynebacterium suedekumii]
MRELLSDGDPAAPLVVYIGRISPEKNLALLGEVMPVLRERVPGARLALVGSGPGVDDLRSRLDPAWSTFTGYLSGADLAAAFASGDVFVFPSHTETLGLVALESMASGVPVVGARAGGIPFVIDDHETGILVDADASPVTGPGGWPRCSPTRPCESGCRRRDGRRPNVTPGGNPPSAWSGRMRTRS